jgi:hypothetical protein
LKTVINLSLTQPKSNTDTTALKCRIFRIFLFWTSSNIGLNDNNIITYYAPNIGCIICFSLELKVEYFFRKVIECEN